MAVHSIDAEDDPFAYRYDTQLLIDRRDDDLDEDAGPTADDLAAIESDSFDD